mgnify:CR=1 FL=1
MRFLGIDYGSKRVGLSLSDEEGSFAFPYKIIKNDLGLVDTVHNICGEEEVSAIVIGESHNSEGERNKIMGSVEEFKHNLEGELELPIYFEKEFMTTVHARELLKQTGHAGKEINNAKKVVKDKQEQADASAAALILQRYLDRKNNKDN